MDPFRAFFFLWITATLIVWVLSLEVLRILPSSVEWRTVRFIAGAATLVLGMILALINIFDLRISSRAQSLIGG